MTRISITWFLILTMTHSQSGCDLSYLWHTSQTLINHGEYDEETSFALPLFISITYPAYILLSAMMDLRAMNMVSDGLSILQCSNPDLLSFRNIAAPSKHIGIIWKYRRGLSVWKGNKPNRLAQLTNDRVKLHVTCYSHSPNLQSSICVNGLLCVGFICNSDLSGSSAGISSLKY